jgi:hypothetical protein
MSCAVWSEDDRLRIHRGPSDDYGSFQPASLDCSASWRVTDAWRDSVMRLWARGRCVGRPHRHGGRVRATSDRRARATVGRVQMERVECVCGRCVSGGACAVSVGAVSGAERREGATKTSKHLEAAGGAYRAEMLALVRA